MDQFTYACIRMMISQTGSGSFFQNELSSILSQKLRSGGKWRFRRFPRVKKISSSGSEIRDWLCPSPVTAFAETQILSWIASSEAYVNHQATFSYLWPRLSEPASFQYYFPHYRKRDRSIHAALLNYPDCVAVVLDVQRYYPSCKKELVLAATNRALKSGMTNEQFLAAISFAESLLENSPEGIPIGPAFGHFLGNVFLHEFDEEMGFQFPDRYFRYVDDIVVVCNKNEVSKAIEIVTNNLGKLQLSLNPEKIDIVEISEWHAWVQFSKDKEREVSFEDCILAIAFASIPFPEKIQRLSNELEALGFLLPIKKIRSLSSNPRFHWFGYFRIINDFLRNARRSKLTQIIKFGILPTLLKVRDDLFSEVADIEKYLSQKRRPTQKRWGIQRLKYAISRLMYLVPISEYRGLLKIVSPFEEVFEIQILLRAIISNNYESITNFPGRLQSAYSELQGARKIDTPIARVDDKTTEAQLESLASLVLGGTIKVEFCNEAEKDEKGFPLRLCAAAGPLKPPENNFSDSYWREIEWLFQTASRESFKEIFESRWSYDEKPQLDCAALGVMGYYL
ncbi:MAG: RNA-directed DNA polymerase [Candidatus Riflebacteria bacterium]|nr:RNA-directed DNA polymerase [Candidatus Riflebacteria bacterium]